MKIITGVEIKELVIHKDKRGFFCELIRKSDKFFRNINFAQLSHSKVNENVFKAWHLHKKQSDFIYCADGKTKLVLFDNRKKSPTYKNLMEIILGKRDKQLIVKIPPGVAHGYKIIKGPAQIIYLMDREYDSKDEIRIPSDNVDIGYNWNL